MKDRHKQCNKYRNKIFTGYEIGRHNDDGDDEISRTGNQIENSVKTNNEINRRRPDFKNQGYIESKKNENCVRFLAVNPRGFGPEQRKKTMMVKSSIKECEIDML